MLTTTLNKIRQFYQYPPDWKKLLKSLGKTEADDEPITLEYILESNGLDDALLALQAVDGYSAAKRLLACNYAEPALPFYEAEYPSDTRARQAIETSRRFAWGNATEEELTAAWDAALNAAWDAARDAWAAWVALDAARAALAAVWAASAAARDAWEAASDAALNAAQAAQSAEFLKFCRLEGEYGEVSKGAQQC